MASAFSIQAWIKTNTKTGYQAIFSRDVSTTLPRDWQFRVAQTTGVIELVRFDSSNAFIETVAGATDVTNNVFHHIVVTFSTTNGVRIYVDNSQDGTSNNTTANHSSSSGLQPSIGADNTAGSVSTWINWFLGAIDELALWNRELSSSEVSQLYNSGLGLAYPFSNSYSQILTETVTFSDSLVKSIVRNLTENPTFTDTLTKEITRNLTEVATFTETFLRSIAKNLVETVTFTDTLIKSISRTLTETVTFVDSLVKGISRTLSESVNFLDTLGDFILNNIRAGINTIIRSTRSDKPEGGTSDQKPNGFTSSDKPERR